MVYMAAGDSNSLDMVAVRDLKEMERGLRGNPNVRVVVEINRHWPRGAQRYEVKASGSQLFNRHAQLPGNTDMGKEKTLADFLTTVAKDFPADHYCLVLWGHAFGLGFGRDHNDPLILPELQRALLMFRKKREELEPGTDGRLDLLAANACSMSYLEAAYQLREAVQLMVASQITTPFSGLPYDAILSRVADKTEPIELAQLIIDAYVHQFDDLPGGDRLQMTLLNLEALLDLEKTEEVDLPDVKTKGLDLRVAVAALAGAIESDIRSVQFDAERMSFYRDVFMGAAAGDVRPLIDLVRLLEALGGDGETDDGKPVSEDVREAAACLLKVVLGTTDRPAGPPDCKATADVLKAVEGAHGPLVVCQSKHPDLDDLNGIGIFAPFVTDQANLALLGLDDTDPEDEEARKARKKENKETGRDIYEGLDLFKLGEGRNRAGLRWPKLVYDGLQRTIPRDLQPTIDGIAELQAGDRADVAQIIMAIESSFNQLDRAVARAAQDMHNSMNAAASPDPQPKVTSSPPVSSAGYTTYSPFNRSRLKLLPLPPVPDTKDKKDPVRPYRKALRGRNAGFDGMAADRLVRVEGALTEVERTTKRGFTHARFGLGPLSSTSSGFGLERPKSGGGLERPKSGGGLERPKSGGGLERPKSGGGLERPKSGGGDPGAADDVASTGDLRIDLALTRVADLFRQVGASLQDLELAASGVESATETLLNSLDTAADAAESREAGDTQDVDRAFELLQATSSNVRRTIRRVLAHPVYGLGPAEDDGLTFDVRQDLAERGGLDKLHLRLL